jgi:hypothetical protein
MRTVLRVALEGSTILASAFLTAALYCVLRSIWSRHAAVAFARSEPRCEPRTDVRGPIFLSRNNLL